MKQILALCLCLCCLSALSAQKTIRMDDPPQTYPPSISKGEYLGAIPALRTLKPQTEIPKEIPAKLAQKRNYFFANKLNNPNAEPQDGDPLATLKADNREGGPEVTLIHNIEGLRDPGGITPPDPTGDIGKNHYLQMTNASGGSWMQVWDKATGQPVFGPVLSSTIWGQVNSGSIGDPIVQYDHDADRWLIMELQGFFTNELLLAISDDSDPTGSWKAYRFQTQGFGDYPKLYVWPNAYFITVNEISGGNECSGYALEREAILNGEPFFDLYRFVMPNYEAIIYQPATGADWEGPTPPPAGSPGYIFRVYDDGWDGGQDHLQIWEVNVNWNDASQSNLSGPEKVFPAPFETRVCFGGGLFDCIEQPDAGAPRLTALENIIMYRAPYRNFGTHESVVLNHVSDISSQVGDGGDAAVRWYELRKSGAGNWQIHQQGTYAPDHETNRFMGTICTDEAGNIALGYSGVGPSVFPGLYLSGRRFTDPPGEMPVEEFPLAPGAQNHTQSNRWGDYSNMSVDPEDGRTFWFTGEYQPGNANWGTRIGAFKLQVDTFDIKPIVLLAPQSSALLSNGEAVQVKILNGGLVTAEGFSVSLLLDGNLIATEAVPGQIPAGQTLDYTFAATVDMPVVGVDYQVQIITHYSPDQFVRNDTLKAVVQKLTSNDVAAVGRYNLPGLVCGSETDFGIIFRNASGLPLTSAKIHWRINNQPFNIYQWTGNLAAGAKDTIDLHATGIQDGLNGLKIFTSEPNGVQDERTSNDTLSAIKFIGNLDGTYLTAEAETVTGVLGWELRSQTDVLLALGEMSAGQGFTQICSEDGTCYKFYVKANSFHWQGHFRLLDIYGNVLVEVTDASPDAQLFNICTPTRSNIDVGAFSLTAPVSGPGLTVNESIKISFRNFGLTPQTGIELSYRVNGGAWKTETFSNTVNAGATANYTFSTTEDLSIVGNSYQFDLKATVPGDQKPNNDLISAVVKNRANRELEIVSVRPVQACNDPSFAFVGALIRNNGLGEEINFDMEIVANGVPQPTLPVTLLLPPDQETEFLVFVQGLQLGLNTVDLNITNVQGQGEDEFPDNDGGSTSFTIIPDGFPVQLFFNTNGNPEQNTWQVKDDQNNVVASGGPYPTAFGAYGQELCLEKDKCYTFHLFDTGGNGMDGGIVDLFSPLGGSLWTYLGGNFGTELVANFCTQDLCSNFLVNTTVECPSPTNGKITMIPSGGTAPYQFSLNGGNFQSDPVFDNLNIGIYFVQALDANNCAYQTEVDLCTVSTVEPGANRRMVVYPNPTSGMAQLELPALEGEQSHLCEVMDVKGQVVQQLRLVRWDQTLKGMVILDKHPAGIYFARVKVGNRAFVTKIIKK
ncbi:MAG: T9SS type A sorting domain-containing protein [Saprospiraceae bacterium]|nr:T9SS type A sorting domain-containing protein [Saprospiraceae bacterium]